MGLLEEAQQAQGDFRKGGTCAIEKVLGELDEQDTEDLVAALADYPAIMHTTLSKVLKARGHQVSEQAVRRHRNGSCVCPR